VLKTRPPQGHARCLCIEAEMLKFSMLILIF